MASRDVVVIGASAGGIEALRAVVGAFPAGLPAAVLVVLHIPRSSPSALPRILDRSGALPASHAVNGEPLRHGRIYVAPADHHLLVRDGSIGLSRGPTENGHRPAVDPLFRSAARAYGPRVVGVVLSGARDDGTAGLATVRARGGVTVVQEPDEALHPSMPRSAIEHDAVDHVLPAANIGTLIATLAGEHTAEDGFKPDPQLDEEAAMAEMSADPTPDYLTNPAGFGCPTCNGSLFALGGDPVPRYRCRIGHAWSPESLLDEHAATFEGALWMALRSLEEKGALAARMAAAARGRRNNGAAARYETTATEAETAAGLIRRLIRQMDAGAAAPDHDQAPDQARAKA